MVGKMGDIRIQRYYVSLRRVFFSAVWGHWDVSYLKLAEICHMPYYGYISYIMSYIHSKIEHNRTWIFQV